MKLFLAATKQTTRNKILQSALLLFVEKGFFKTSMPDLVQHSGVSNGSIYYHFKDKQQVAEGLMSELINYIEEEQKQILSQYSSTWERYYQLTAWMFQASEQQPHLMQFVLKAQHQEFLPESPPICSSKPFLNLRDVIAHGMQHNEIKQMDIMVAAALAFGAPLRLIQLSLDKMLDQPLTHYLDDITHHAWLALSMDESPISQIKIANK